MYVNNVDNKRGRHSLPLTSNQNNNHALTLTYHPEHTDEDSGSPVHRLSQLNCGSRSGRRLN